MRRFARAAQGATSFAGSGRAVIVIVVAVVAWLGWGLASDFSRGWELAATAGAPILTLLMKVYRELKQDAKADDLKARATEVQDFLTRLSALKEASV